MTTDNPRDLVSDDTEDAVERVLTRVQNELQDAEYQPVEDEFRALFSLGLSPAQVIDYWLVRIQGYARTEAGEIRGVAHQAVAQNVRQAEEKIAEADTVPSVLVNAVDDLDA